MEQSSCLDVLYDAENRLLLGWIRCGATVASTQAAGREFEMAEVLYNFAHRQNKNRSRNNKEAKVRGSRMSECGDEDDTGK